jgi:SAM-dependent methyltransferase
VTRYWRDAGPEVSGSDLSAEAIEWCRRNLSFARFEVNGLAPPLAFESGSFDLVYALSVLTHLTEELQLAWMREFARVLRPGGRLLVTTHGDRYREKLTAEERARYDAGELVVRWGEVAGTNLAAAYHPPAWVRAHLAGELEQVAFSPEGAAGNPHQDVHVFRK